MLKNVVEQKVGFKCRYIKLGTSQRNAMHFASATDANEAAMCGRAAVRAAMDGVSGQMVTLLRRQSSKGYECTTGLADLADVANGEKKVPPEYINHEGNFITEAFRRYASPLIHGQVDIEVADDGLPVYVRLEKQMLKKKTPAYELK